MFRINRYGEYSFASQIYDFFRSKQNERVTTEELKKYVVDNIAKDDRCDSRLLGARISQATHQLLDRGMIVRIGRGKFALLASGSDSIKNEAAITEAVMSKIGNPTKFDETILKSYDRHGVPTTLNQVYQCFLARRGKVTRTADIKRYRAEHFPNGLNKNVNLSLYINLLMSRNLVVNLRWGVWTLHPSVEGGESEMTTYEIHITAETKKVIDMTKLQDDLAKIGLSVTNIGITIKQSES